MTPIFETGEKVWWWTKNQQKRNGVVIRVYTTRTGRVWVQVKADEGQEYEGHKTLRPNDLQRRK